ncbi:hypothetical protein ARMSODRAFT_948300 [Armillaria solidipes]|uniref:Uncharacterized protein n=1 Tax=Armillaria solidipes TaxID=1076256 RepID=A0A2H3CK44_9AGAR|nr:hypothetical protein ARMSODRAFT_948300 [Armillaria solidipes]
MQLPFIVILLSIALVLTVSKVPSELNGRMLTAQPLQPRVDEDSIASRNSVTKPLPLKREFDSKVQVPLKNE